MTQSNFEKQVLTRIEDLNRNLNSVCRVLLPMWITEPSVRYIENLAAQLPNVQGSHQQDLLREIDMFIAREGFYPQLRAFQCYRATEVPFVQTYSHHLERATLHYFRRDYMSAILVLAPVIEGIILDHMQSPMTTIVRPNQIFSHLQGLQPNHFNDPAYANDPRLPARFSSFRLMLVNFLQTRFFPSASAAQAQGNFAFSMLNRNYILHQLGSQSFDNLHDCQSMFQLFDLLLETFACQTGKSTGYCFVLQTPEINNRESLYWAAVLQDYFGAGVQLDDHKILSYHPNYVPKPEDTNWLAMHASPGHDTETMTLLHGLNKLTQDTRNALILGRSSWTQARAQKFDDAMALMAFVTPTGN